MKPTPYFCPSCGIATAGCCPDRPCFQCQLNKNYMETVGKKIWDDFREQLEEEYGKVVEDDLTRADSEFERETDR